MPRSIEYFSWSTPQRETLALDTLHGKRGTFSVVDLAGVPLIFRDAQQPPPQEACRTRDIAGSRSNSLAKWDSAISARVEATARPP
jgi:hypothetical protein